MFVQLNCVIVDGDANNRQELSAFLAHHNVLVTTQLTSIDQLGPVLARPDAPQLALVNLDPNVHESLHKISNLPRQFQNVSFFLMSQTLDANVLMEAMHLGVKEFIPLPMSPDKLSAAIERVANAFGKGKRARIIHVVPTIGGCGSTTVACNLAASLTKIGRTVLLDLDLIRGGVASYFDLRPRYTIADVMDSAEKLDQQLLDNALAMHKGSGLAILSRPELPEETQRVNGPGLGRLLSVLGRGFDFIVMDSIMSIDPLYATAIGSSDINLLVMQLQVPSAKNAERFVGVLRRSGVEANKINIVVNRYVKKGCDIEPDEVERALGLKISWMIPNDFKSAIAAINFGEPVVMRSPKSEISVSLRELASSLAGSHAANKAA